MAQSIVSGRIQSTAANDAVERQVDEALDWLRPQLIELVQTLHEGGLTPVRFLCFEQGVFRLLLAFVRVVLAVVHAS